MRTQIDWHEELDSSFGRAPDLPAAHYVVAGRGALRRRRIAAAVVAASFAVAGGATWATSPGAAPRGDAPIATQGPAPTQGTDERADRQAEPKTERRRDPAPEELDFLGNPAVLTEQEMVLAPQTGAVLQRVRNPMGYLAAQGRSLAIRAMYEGREQYSLMAYFADGGTSTSTVDNTGDFAGWLEGAVGTQAFLDDANGVTSPSDQAVPDPWLRLDGAGQVAVAGDNVVLVEVRTQVDLGADFSRDTDRTGVVRLLVDGQPEFAAYRVTGPRLEVITPSSRFDSLSAFVAWARLQYGSGQGMR
ncbi:MAG: hypothetical protein LH477_01095 [Nocardioides sp.]|nr:hypothetical protein [Nocardioides sp.]